MSEIIQYDTSETVVGGINIAESIQTNEKIIFNESYTVTGTRIAAPSVYACYNLTVIGDMDVEYIEVKGNLNVIGDIRAKRIACLKAIICSGNIDAENISASEIVANDIACHQITCTGNIVARTTIDVRDSLKTEKSVMAGEGIVGSGEFSAQNAIAVEYVDFHGDIYGKVMELETGVTFGEFSIQAQEDVPIEDVFDSLRSKISDELEKAGNVDEDELVGLVMRLSKMDKAMLSDWAILTEKLIDISYMDKIINFRDYLTVVLANKLLPEEIKGYETIEHIFSNFLVDAENSLENMEFYATDVEELTYALKSIILCENEIKLEKESAFDRIFQSIGIKYKTVKGFFD